MKLEKLTPEQEAKMEEVKSFWLEYIFSCKNTEINKKALKIGIEWLYKFCGYDSPVLIAVDSPLGCQYATHLLKEIINNKTPLDNVSDNVRANVSDNVWTNVSDNVWTNVWANVRDNVWTNVRDNIQHESFSLYGNIGDYGWVSFYDFFTEIGILNNKDFNSFKEILLSGIYDMIQLNGFCIVSSMPTKIERDSENRLPRTCSH